MKRETKKQISFNGWFILTTVLPACFAIGSVVKKTLCMGNKIESREVLNLTVILDHDVIDGASIVSVVKKLTKNIEEWLFV